MRPEPKPGDRLRHRITGRIGAVVDDTRIRSAGTVKVKPETALPSAWVQVGSDQGTLPVWWEFDLTEEAGHDTEPV